MLLKLEIKIFFKCLSAVDIDVFHMVEEVMDLCGLPFYVQSSSYFALIRYLRV